MLDAALRADPPAAGALRARLALANAAASDKILRANTDEAERDLRFAVGDPLGPAANLLSLWRDLAGRPPSLDPGRIHDAAAALDLAPGNRDHACRKACGTTAGQGSGLGGREGGRPAAFSALPGHPSGRSRDPRPLGVRPRHPATPAAICG